MNTLVYLRRKLSKRERRRSERRIYSDLVALYDDGSAQKQSRVRDINSSGMYLLTQHHFATEEVVSLTLKWLDPPEGKPGYRSAVQARPIQPQTGAERVVVKARPVRMDKDGVGLAWVLPKGMELHFGANPQTSGRGQAELDLLFQFRKAQAIAFLKRICPQSSERVHSLLNKDLSSLRVANVVEIVVKAETILASKPHSENVLAPVHLVVRILEDGSWTEDSTTRDWWAGLLASSCTIEGNDESNLDVVDLLSKLRPLHIHILAAACMRARIVDPESTTALPFSCATREMINITGVHDLLSIEREIGTLSDLRLLTQRAASFSFTPMETINVTPTGLGLRMYARCCGHIGPLQSFYDGVSLASAS